MNELIIQPFEEEIMREFHPPIGEAPGFYGKGTMKSRLGIWIRQHLTEIGEDYPYRMWKRWNALCITANSLGIRIPLNNYTQFVIYMRLLEMAKLIRVVREVPYRLENDPEKRIRIKYYSTIKMNLDNELWNNPRKGSPSYKTWKDIPPEKKEEYYKSRRRKAVLRYATRYGIPISEVPEELRGRPGLLPRQRE